MRKTRESVDPRVPIDRQLGFNVVKDIFMMTAMKDQSKALGSKRVLNLPEYQEKQTNLCVAIAVDASNNFDISKPVKEETEKFNITEVVPLKSNCIIGNKLDQKDQNLYFHTNFMAKSGGDIEKSLYFAEVKGDERPEEALCCIKLTNGGVIENCAFCTGIRHPSSENFFGKILPLKTYSRKRRRDCSIS